MSTKLVIERRCYGLAWEVFAHPKDDVADALRLMRKLEDEERKKPYKSTLRLVCVITEVIAP